MSITNNDHYKNQLIMILDRCLQKISTIEINRDILKIANVENDMNISKMLSYSYNVFTYIIVIFVILSSPFFTTYLPNDKFIVLLYFNATGIVMIAIFFKLMSIKAKEEKKSFSSSMMKTTDSLRNDISSPAWRSLVAEAFNMLLILDHSEISSELKENVQNEMEKINNSNKEEFDLLVYKDLLNNIFNELTKDNQ